MDMSAVLEQMFILFFIMIVGFIAGKTGIMGAEGNKLLTRVILNISVPSLILSSVIDRDQSMGIADAGYFMLFSFISYIIVILIAMIVPKLLRTGSADKGLYQYMTIFGNVTFMGFPVLSAIFGQDILFYIALYNMPFHFLAFSLGIMLISGKKGNKFNFRLLLSPALIASAIALVIFVFNIQMPSIIGSTASILGQITTPGAMLIIGASLSSIPFREVFSELRLYLLSFIKLILIPVILWAAFRPFIKDETILGALVIISAMPIATNTTMISMEYGGNEALASKGVFISTVLSIATIPLMVYLLL